ncbi:hypothetical protein AB1Y20_004411 [Prymnesium parvum]|uniref:Nucleolar 27S pre-rRNA processing Urb2/Npa2 C-terminal domain-containing protein n=1 Tax=Prymnesium parvum TaxID=97485 RepID=A0AB34IXY4_PRYPA
MARGVVGEEMARGKAARRKGDAPTPPLAREPAHLASPTPSTPSPSPSPAAAGAAAAAAGASLEVFRTLRAAATQVSLEQKLELAHALLDAADTSFFPHPAPFLADWLCNALRAKRPAERTAPRASPHAWRLLVRLLRPAAPPPALAHRLVQSSRLLLHAAAAALHEATAELCEAAGEAVEALLCAHGAWFRPGTEAVGEFVARAAGAARLALLAADGAPSDESRAAAAAQLRVALRGVRALLRLCRRASERTTEMPPRKALLLLCGKWLRPVLELSGVCMAHAAHASPPAELPPLPAAAECAAEIHASVLGVIFDVEHLPEYTSWLQAAACDEDPSRESGGARSGKRQKTAAGAAEAGAAGRDNYTRSVFSALGELAAEDETIHNEREQLLSRGKRPPIDKAPLLDVLLPEMIVHFSRACGAQQQKLSEERSARQQLLRPTKKPADDEPPSLPADFLLASHLLRVPLASLTRLLPSHADPPLPAAAAAALDAARLLGATARSGAYRPRQDSSGRQRAALAPAWDGAIGLAAALVGHSPPPRADQAAPRAHAAVCDLLRVLAVLDSIALRPHLPLVLQLLALTTPLPLSPPHPLTDAGVSPFHAADGAFALAPHDAPLSLALHLAAACSAERQLPLLVQLLASQARGARGGLGAVMGWPRFWKACAAAVDVAPAAQAAELCEAALHPLETLVASAIPSTHLPDDADMDAAAAWQLSCVLCCVLDAVPVEQHNAPSLHAITQRVHAIASTLADSPPSPADAASLRVAAGVQLWRSADALAAAAHTLQQPGWPERLPRALPRALQAAHAALERKGEARGAAPLLHHELVLGTTRHLPAAPLTPKRAARLRRRLARIGAALTSWRAADARAAAGGGAAAAWGGLPSQVTAARAFAAQWAIAADALLLIDAYAKPKRLQRWLATFWETLCTPSEGAAQQGSAHMTSLGLLRSAAFFELPAVRGALLPAAWAYILTQLPPPSSPLLAALHSASTSLPASWPSLLDATPPPPRLTPAAWSAIRRACVHLAALPAAWYPPDQCRWLLPAALLLAHLAQRDGGGGGGGALRAAMELCVPLLEALAAQPPLPPSARGVILRWSLALPAVAPRLEALCAPLCEAVAMRNGIVGGGVVGLEEEHEEEARGEGDGDEDEEGEVTRDEGEGEGEEEGEEEEEEEEEAEGEGEAEGVAAEEPEHADDDDDDDDDDEEWEAWRAEVRHVLGSSAPAEPRRLCAALSSVAGVAAARGLRGCAPLDALCAVPPPAAAALLGAAAPPPAAEARVLARLMAALSRWVRCAEASGAPPPPPMREAVACCVRLLPLLPREGGEGGEKREEGEGEGEEEEGEEGEEGRVYAELRASLLAMLDACAAAAAARLPPAEAEALASLLLAELRESHVSFGPTGRLRPQDGAPPAAALRRLLFAAPPAAFGGLVARLAAPLAAPAGAADARAALVGLALACGAKAEAHAALLSSRRGALLCALGGAAAEAAEAYGEAGDSVRRLALQALTALATNGQVRFERGDGTVLLHAAASATAHLRLGEAAAALPSPATFDAAYFLLLALLRQRPKAVHSALPLLLVAVRGMLCALGHAAPGGSAERLPVECARNLRRLLEEVATHKKHAVRHGSHILADVVAVYRELPLPAAAQKELLPGIHALLGMLTEVEVQAVHASSNAVSRRLLQELLSSYEASFKYKGKA